MSLSLMSAEFLGLPFVTAVLLAVLVGAARQAVFLAVNLLFLWTLLLGPESTCVTVLFTLLGYGLTRLILRQPRCLVPALLGYLLLFVYLRQYSFLVWLLPQATLAHTLSTIGLSFLFFKIVHVMIEARSGTLGVLELPTFVNYSLNFTTFMSGPIQRYQDYTAQWYGRELAIPLTFEAHLDAVLRILIGFVKAYVIAALLFPLTEPESPDRLAGSVGGLFVNVYAYFFFLYFNFSGYCDVVIGMGSLLGVRPPENFDKPFLARNISDYWFRWHRSLTLWLTHYVFSPLYKWFLSHPRTASRPLLSMNVALLVTMVVSGLWHGTTLNFLLWGIAHGFYLMVFRTWESLATHWFGKAWLRSWRKNRAAQLTGMVLTFNVVAFTLILFRFEAEYAFRMLADVANLKLWDSAFLRSSLGRILHTL